MAANTNRERYEFIERMFSGLDGISPEKVIGSYIHLEQRGRHFMGLCPFHKDTKLGSFLVTPDKGIWKCFTCGDEYAGNAVKFVSLYKGLTYLEAAFDIAMQFGIITRGDYDKYSKKKYDEGYVKKLEKRYSDKAKDEPKPIKANPQTIHNVYSVMKELSPLTDEHRKALVEERKLPKERIEQDYFSCPLNWKQKDNIVLGIKNKLNVSDEVLQTVPGFFYDKKQKKVTFAGYKGLCILIRNAYGQIQGVQIRRDTIKEGDSRYVWMSSTFAFYKPDEYEGGCGCGSPKDVLWGKTDKVKNSMCITEGRFKSEILSQNGNTTISIQGVTSWNGLNTAIQDIRKKQHIKYVYIFLDSDILGKHALFSQSAKMCDSIKETFPDLTIKYAFWNKSKGKGIDDYINNAGSTKGICYWDYKEASELGNKAFKYVLEKFNVTRLQDLPDKDIVAFETRLQNVLEKRLIS